MPRLLIINNAQMHVIKGSDYTVFQTRTQRFFRRSYVHIVAWRWDRARTWARLFHLFSKAGAPARLKPDLFSEIYFSLKKPKHKVRSPSHIRARKIRPDPPLLSPTAFVHRYIRMFIMLSSRDANPGPSSVRSWFDVHQDCQIFSCYNTPKRGKIYQMT
jgi:hypothetical protein